MKRHFTKTRKSIGKSMSVLMSMIMSMGLCATPTLYTKAADEGYDVIITKVGLYQSEGKNMVYAEYCNDGNADVDTDFPMTFYVDRDNKITVTAEANGLKPHETKRVSAVVEQSLESSKKYEIMAVANVKDAIQVNNNRTSYRKVQTSEPIETTAKPTETTTEASTAKPTEKPTEAPTEKPTEKPTEAPTPAQDIKAEVVALGGYSTEAEAGDEITITAVVQNTGNVDIPANSGINVDISVDGILQKTVTLNQEIPVNACVTIDTTWTATIGGHTFTAAMNKGSASSVSKKLNVTRKINRDFTRTSGVDLVVTDVGYYNETTGTYNSDIKAGDHIKFIAYGANAGSEKGPDNVKYGVSFRVNGAGVGNATWSDDYIDKPGMPAGSTYDFLACGGDGDKAYWEATATEGNVTVKAIIDDQNKISETNEGNNEKEVTINVPNTINSVVTDAPDVVSDALERLGEVSGLTVTNATEKRIILSWLAASGATSYNVYRDGQYIGSTVSMSYVDNGTFQAGQQYQYTVKAVQYKAESSGKDATAIPEANKLEVKAYPVPSGLTQSSGITMTADGENVGVFRTRVSDDHSWIANHNPDTFSNVAIFDYEGGDAEVKIRVSNKNVSSVSVRPVQKGLTAKIEHQGNDSIITINMPDGKQGQYDIDLNNTAGREDQIYLFTKEIMDAPADAWKVIKAGQIETGHIEVPDNATLYIEGGGRLEGYVHMGHNSKLLGRGVITQVGYGSWDATDNRNNPLSVGYEPLRKGNAGGEGYGRNNVEIEGISILDSTGWALNVRNSHDVSIKDVNIMTARSNGDGITVQSSYKVTIDGCFLRTYDDSIVVKNYDNINSHDIKVTDCTIWTDLAQTLEIGWETDMSGTNGRTEAGLKNNDPKIYNIFYKDIYVLHNYHKPVLSIHNGDNVPIYHVAYKNIYIEDKQGAGDGMGGVIDRRIEAHRTEGWTTNWHTNGYIDDIWYYNVSDTSTGVGTGSNIHMNKYVADNFLGW